MGNSSECTTKTEESNLRRLFVTVVRILAPHIVRDWSFHCLRGTHPAVFVAYLKVLEFQMNFVRTEKRAIKGNRHETRQLQIRIHTSLHRKHCHLVLEELASHASPQSTRPEKKEKDISNSLFDLCSDTGSRRSGWCPS